MQNIVIFGAYSAIAKAVARRYAPQGARFFLVGRNESRLKALCEDLAARGAGEAVPFPCDLADRSALEAAVSRAWEAMGRVDLALLAHGTLPDQQRCQESLKETFSQMENNALSQIGLLTLMAPRFERQRGGCVAAITSVAGDRGRGSNYVYGAAKKAVSVFLEGLRHRLASRDVRVLDIRPGFVDTPMTADFAKGLLWASPEQVAGDIEKAVARGRAVLYTPWFWRLVMLAVRSLPRFAFHKTHL